MTAQKHAKNRPAYADVRTMRLAANVRVAGVEPADQAEFKDSIRTHGVKSPLGVRLAPDGVTEVIFGQRRFTTTHEVLTDIAEDSEIKSKAEREALIERLAVVPIHWDDTPDDAIRTVQLIENLQRSDMNPIDIAAAVWDMYNNEAGGSQSFIAEVLGKPKSWVSKMMKLGIDLPDAANTVARGLMLANQLGDADMASLLCQIEEVNLTEAQRVGKEIASFVKAQQAHAKDPTEGTAEELAKQVQHTRVTLRNILKQVRTAGDDTPQPESAGNDQSGDGQPDDTGTPGEPVVDHGPALWMIRDALIAHKTKTSDDAAIKSDAMAIIVGLFRSAGITLPTEGQEIALN